MKPTRGLFTLLTYETTVGPYRHARQVWWEPRKRRWVRHKLDTKITWIVTPFYRNPHAPPPGKNTLPGMHVSLVVVGPLPEGIAIPASPNALRQFPPAYDINSDLWARLGFKFAEA